MKEFRILSSTKMLVCNNCYFHQSITKLRMNAVLDAIIVGIVVAVNTVIIAEYFRISRLFKNFIFDFQLTLFSLDSTEEGVVNDLSEICERILRLLRIEVMNVLNAVFNTVRNHIFLKHVVHEVWFERQVICNLQETLSNVARNRRFWFVLQYSNLFIFTILNQCCKKLFIVDVML